MGALVLLIVASGDAEGDEAASKPAANEAENETQDPGKGALVLIDVSHADLAAVLASDGDGVVWPVTSWVHRLDGGGGDHHDWLSRLLLLHHGLTGNGLSVGLLRSVLLLSGHGGVAGLRLSHLRLSLAHKRLLLGNGVTGSDGLGVGNRFAIHLCSTILYTIKSNYNKDFASFLRHYNTILMSNY